MRFCCLGLTFFLSLFLFSNLSSANSEKSSYIVVEGEDYSVLSIRELAERYLEKLKRLEVFEDEMPRKLHDVITMNGLISYDREKLVLLNSDYDEIILNAIASGPVELKEIGGICSSILKIISPRGKDRLRNINQSDLYLSFLDYMIFFHRNIAPRLISKGNIKTNDYILTRLLELRNLQVGMQEKIWNVYLSKEDTLDTSYISKFYLQSTLYGLAGVLTLGILWARDWLKAMDFRKPRNSGTSSLKELKIELATRPLISNEMISLPIFESEEAKVNREIGEILQELSDGLRRRTIELSEVQENLAKILKYDREILNSGILARLKLLANKLEGGLWDEQKKLNDYINGKARSK